MKFVPEVIGRTISRNTLVVQKASPEVLLVAGIAGLVGSTVLACRATLKAETVMEEAKMKMDLAKGLDHPDYSESDRKRDVTLVYFQNGVKLARLYAPAIIVGGISIYALTSSHRILTRRNIALTAAYGALEKGFNEYRARVIEKYGEEEDLKFRFATEQAEITDPETGKRKTVTRINVDEDPSIYARFFDQTCGPWSKDPEHNLFFLKCQQNWANDLLKSRGHVFLNEVYDMCDIPRSKAGAVVGWLYTKDGSTDNFVNFGVFDGREQVTRDFVNGREGAILLDFNVDGVIYDKLDK